MPAPPAANIAPAERQRLQRLRSWCTGCRTHKPWIEFWARTRWSDGTMRLPQSRCKTCVKADRRAARKADPEKARQRDRVDWKRLMADPRRRKVRRNTQRENSTAFRRRQAERVAEDTDQRRDAG